MILNYCMVRPLFLLESGKKINFPSDFVMKKNRFLNTDGSHGNERHTGTTRGVITKCTVHNVRAVTLDYGLVCFAHNQTKVIRE